MRWDGVGVGEADFTAALCGRRGGVQSCVLAALASQLRSQEPRRHRRDVK